MSEGLDPRALEALRSDREAPAPDDARASVASRLGVSGLYPGPRARRGTVARRVTGGMHTTSLLAVAFVAGAAVGALVHARVAPASASRIVYVDRPAPSIPSATFAATSSTTQLPSAGASALPATAISATVVASPPHAGLAQLDAERALLDTARVALVSGDSATALEALDRHTQTYRHPILGEERDALFVQTLVRAGRYDEARTRAETFRREAPRSLFGPAVDAAILSIP
jgi:hypothetical protein